MSLRTRRARRVWLPAASMTLALLAGAGCAEVGFEPGPPGGGDDGRAGALAEEGLGALDQVWGCGEGFVLSDEEQTAALHIRVPEPGAAPPREGLVGEQWVAELRFGSDLMANWCDDVLEPGEPEPDVEVELPGVAGTVTIDGSLPPEPPTCPSDVRASLEGLVVEDDSGQRFELGGAPLRNEFWGCYAG